MQSEAVPGGAAAGGLDDLQGGHEAPKGATVAALAPFGEAGPLPSPADPDLAALVAAWPTLPAAVRSAVLALVGQYQE